jgi:O-antigen/teichoic acid export membrane protein
MSERDLRESEVRERKARRAIGWGAAIVLGFMALGCMLLIFPVATGMRIPYIASELDWVVVIGSSVIGLIGLAVTLYGLVQLARSRRDDEQTA